MNNLKKFRFKLKHDNGSVYISIFSSSEENAKRAICIAENCPERALTLMKK